MIQPVNQKLRINLLRVQMLLLLPLILLTVPVAGLCSRTHEWVEMLGLGLLLVGVLGRFWAVLYVGGRKNGQVVSDGPYSLTRNPLYLFSTIAVVGVGLMLGSVTLAAILGLSIGTTLYITALREARYLEASFGDDYRAYAREVPFFLPRLHGYRSEQAVTFSPAALRANFLDALVFLSFIPIAEALEMLRAGAGLDLVRLP